MSWPAVTAQDIEIAVAKHFGYRANIIVPNVYWGLGLNYEADLVILRPSGWAIEVEIKTSAADIRADLKKRWRHDSQLFRQVYFAVPEALAVHRDIPEWAGVLSVIREAHGDRVRQIRVAKLRPSRKWEPKTRQKLMELAAMRTWTLKQHLAQQAKQRRCLASELAEART